MLTFSILNHPCQTGDENKDHHQLHYCHLYMAMTKSYHKQIERESYSHRKCTKVTMVEGINPITTTKKTKIELRILAAMDSCFGLVMPPQHGIANT